MNPVHQKFFRVELYTSDRRMTEEEWNKRMMQVAYKLIELEQELNKDGSIRAHVHAVQK